MEDYRCLKFVEGIICGCWLLAVGVCIALTETIVPWCRDLFRVPLQSSLLLTMLFDTNMSMTCLHKAPAIGDEIKMGVVLMTNYLLRPALFLVGQKVRSAIFKMQPLLLQNSSI